MQHGRRVFGVFLLSLAGLPGRDILAWFTCLGNILLLPGMEEEEEEERERVIIGSDARRRKKRILRIGESVPFSLFPTAPMHFGGEMFETKELDFF